MTKSFYSKWREGMKNLTPLQYLQAKVVGHLGTATGLALATVMLVLKSQWGFAIFTLFLGHLQYLEFLSNKQQYMNMEEMEGKQ